MRLDPISLAKMFSSTSVCPDIVAPWQNKMKRLELYTKSKII